MNVANQAVKYLMARPSRKPRKAKKHRVDTAWMAAFSDEGDQDCEWPPESEPEVSSSSNSGSSDALPSDASYVALSSYSVMQLFQF